VKVAHERGRPYQCLRQKVLRESEMPVVVFEPRKGKSVVSEGALLKNKVYTRKYQA